MQKEIIQAMNERYATQEFNGVKLAPEALDKLLDATRLSSSSFGLQPWKFIVINNPEIRKQIRAAAWDQAKVTDAPHLVLLAVRTDVDAAYVDMYIKAIAETRGMAVDMLKGYSDMMKGSIAGRTPEQVKAWSARQVYIALGTMLTAAAVEGIDAGPMEGFDVAKVDEILGLAKMNLSGCVLVALGYRSPTDKTASYKKVRFAKKDVVITV
jgi:nitroreductase